MIEKFTENLDPFLSKEAIETHFYGHHIKYYENLQKMLPEENNLEKILKDYSKENNLNIYNNAAQLFNHNLFWKSIKLNTFDKDISDFLERKLNFKENLKQIASSVFGSGWVWLVKKKRDGELEIIKTKDGDIPPKEYEPLINLDL
ncbi:MAG: superoxide dismutase, partial [Bacteroidota bacterium]